jgi:serine/threonine protein kinase
MLAFIISFTIFLAMTTIPDFIPADEKHNYTLDPAATCKLGEGTYGTVYLGTYHAPSITAIGTNGRPAKPKDERVAFKVLQNTSVVPSSMLEEIKTLDLLRPNAPGNEHRPSYCVALKHVLFNSLVGIVTLVMAYVPHTSFKNLLPLISAEELKIYMRDLFRGLAFIHERQIIHLDVKPDNYMYDPVKHVGTLGDFGFGHVILGPGEERTNAKNGVTLDPRNSAFRPLATTSTAPIFPTTQGIGASTIPALTKNDVQRQRGGTRGFRAPELVFRFLLISVAVDVYSAACIFLSILLGKNHFFLQADKPTPTAISELIKFYGIDAVLFFCETFSVESPVALNSKDKELPGNPLWNTLRSPEARKAQLEHIRSWQTASSVEKNFPDEAFDLVLQLLELRPGTRLTAAQALQHNFFRLS